MTNDEKRPHLLLASASPARLATLRSAGIDPSVLVSGVDEDAALVAAEAAAGRALSVAEQVAALAQAKARDVAASVPPRADGSPVLVLGCDSILELDGEAHGKPADAATARERWQRMRGRSGTLYTGHHMIDLATGREANAAAATEVDFGVVSDGEIDAYIATGEPLRVAGAFTIDGLGGAFIDGIRGDHHSVVGVSLPLLRRLVAELGYEFTDLWAEETECGRVDGVL